MGLLFTQDVLADVSYVLIEPVVNINLGTAVAGPGIAIITPGSMVGIYVGAQLIVGWNLLNQEVVTVMSLPTPTTFKATFVNAHPGTDLLYAPTFPTGQTDHPLYNQDEMLQYLADAQNDFLLQTRMIWAQAVINAVIGVRAYPQPTDAIRVERIEAAGNELFATATADLDLENPGWQAETSATLSNYFLDEINTGQFGVYPLPAQNTPLTLWYSQKGPPTLALGNGFLVPDPFVRYLKCGVLARAFSKDGEQRDPLRVEFYKKRYEFGVTLGQRFMEATDIADPKQTLEVQVFSRFPIYRSLYGG